MDWREIEKRLCERAEEVCRHLLPNGRRVAHEWCVGSVNGEAGDSMKVNLAGKVGVWCDFAADDKGKTLIGLWCHVRQQQFPVSIKQAKALLGIEDTYERRVKPASSGVAARGDAGTPEKDKSEWQAVVEIWKRCQALTEGGPVWRYLVEERGIEINVLDAFDVREMPLAGGRWAMVFPYFVPHEKEEQSEIEQAIAQRAQGGVKAEKPVGTNRIPTWLKFERLDRPEGKKIEWTTRGPEKCLFGMQACMHAMFKRADHLLICEGEKDVLSWATYGCWSWKVAGSGGVLPVSVPFGAKWKSSNNKQDPRPSPNREWLDRCWEWMQGFETIFVGMDMDEHGRKAAADIITEIGPRRCRLVELPEKTLTTDGHR